MESSVDRLIAQIVGKPCCRRRVWRMRSLHLGFGEKVFPGNQRLVDAFYGEWEIGTYHGGWRVIGGGRVLCGNGDSVDSIDDLDAALKRIELGNFASCRQLTDLDVRLELDNGVAVDFLGTVSDDECFHIRCPGNIYARFSADGGWQVGPSNKPWVEFGHEGKEEEEQGTARAPGDGS